MIIFDKRLFFAFLSEKLGKTLFFLNYFEKKFENFVLKLREKNSKTRIISVRIKIK